MYQAPLLRTKATRNEERQLQIAKSSYSVAIKIDSQRIYKYLNVIAELRIEEMAANIGVARRSPQRQLSAKRGIMAEILLGRFFNQYGINWSEPGKDIRNKYSIARDLGDYQIGNTIYDLKSSDVYASVSTYKRTDNHCKIDYIIGSYMNVDEVNEEIELYIFGVRDYKKLLTIDECISKWNVKYQILNPHDFIPLQETGLFPQLNNVRNVHMK